MEDSCNEDGGEGAALIDSLFQEEVLPPVNIPSEVGGSCVEIEEVGECRELGTLEINDLQ